MRIIPNQGACDPHVHIFNGKAYMFSTHDRGPANPFLRWTTGASFLRMTL